MIEVFFLELILGKIHLLLLNCISNRSKIYVSSLTMYLYCLRKKCIFKHIAIIFINLDQSEEERYIFFLLISICADIVNNIEEFWGLMKDS